MKTLLGLAALGVATAVALGAALGLVRSLVGRAGSATRSRPGVSTSPGRDTAVAPGDRLLRLRQRRLRQEAGHPAGPLALRHFRRAAGALRDAGARDPREGWPPTTTRPASEGKIGAFYRAFMDEAPAPTRWAPAPIAPELAAIRAADSRDRPGRADGRGATTASTAASSTSISSVDAKDPDHYAIYVGQARPRPARPRLLPRAQLRGAEGQVPGLRRPDADAGGLAGRRRRRPQAIVDYGDQDRQGELDRAPSERDPIKTYNPMTPAELAAAAPGFDWSAFLDGADLGDGASAWSCSENTAFPKIAAIFAATPVETLQAWAGLPRRRQRRALSSPAASSTPASTSATRPCAGQQEQRPRWKRAVGLRRRRHGRGGRPALCRRILPAGVQGQDGGAGRQPARGAARRASSSVDLDERRDQGQGAAEARPCSTSRSAIPTSGATIRALQICAGRPRTATSSAPRRSSGDRQRQAAEQAGRPHRVGHDAADGERLLQRRRSNEIVFPAAILQPPFFDPNADPAVNYGGIGGVIGHEMTHGFDDQGRQFDGDGRAAPTGGRPRTTPSSTRAAKRLGAQYSAFEPLPGVHVKGDLTMGENIADLGGLLLALDAYHASLHGKPAPVIDGLTGDQRFFLGWAQVWRGSDPRRTPCASSWSPTSHSPDALPRQRRRAQHRRLVRRLRHQAGRPALPRARPAGADLVGAPGPRFVIPESAQRLSGIY